MIRNFLILLCILVAFGIMLDKVIYRADSGMPQNSADSNNTANQSPLFNARTVRPTVPDGFRLMYGKPAKESIAGGDTLLVWIPALGNRVAIFTFQGQIER